MEQQSANDGLKEKGAAVKWTNLGNCMPRGSKTMKSTSYCVEEEFHTRMWDLKREVSLNPILLVITNFISFIHEMYEGMLCVHRILRIIHL